MPSRRQGDLMQIGDVATRTGLSLRTVRYYEEAGLVAPCDRTAGGFRLYGEAECAKLEVVKQLKPLGFSLEDVSDLLSLLEDVGKSEESDSSRLKLASFVERVDAHCLALAEQLANAQQFAEDLRRQGLVPASKSEDVN